MQLQQLLYFVTVSKTLNFTRAAEQLYVSQPSLSTQLSNLEEELGCQLLLRTTRSVELTPAGHYLAQWAGDFLAQLDRLPDELAQVRSGSIGRLHVGYGSGTQSYLIHAMQALRQALPHIQVLPHRTWDILQMLSMEHDALDAILLPAPCIRGMDWVSSATVAKSGLSLAVPRRHPLSGAQQVSLHCLADQCLLLFPRPQIPRLYDTLIAELRTHGIAPAEYKTVPDSDSVSTMVGAGIGLGLVLDYTAASLPPEVCAIPIEECRSGYDLLLVYPSDTRNPCIPYLEDAIKIH